MKKTPFLTVFLFCCLFGLCAQETGTAAAAGSTSASSGNWQNWIFAGSALAAAALGVTIVAIDSGTFGH